MQMCKYAFGFGSMSSYYAIDDDAIWSKKAPSTHISTYFQGKYSWVGYLREESCKKRIQMFPPLFFPTFSQLLPLSEFFFFSLSSTKVTKVTKVTKLNKID